MANRSTGRWQLTDEVLAPQLWPQTVVTGADNYKLYTSLGWILFELATHPDEQRQLCDESNAGC